MHALRVRREKINIVAGKATTHRGTKRVRLCLAGVCVAQCGQQVHPDQTKAVKGQDRKTLVTAGAIKRPLPCPVERVEKQRAYFTTLKEKQSKRKRKKRRTKTERKKKKTKKERGELVQRTCINRSTSLSPPSKSYISPKNANKDFPIGTITIQGRLPQSHQFPWQDSSWGIICIEKRRSPLFGFAATDKA